MVGCVHHDMFTYLSNTLYLYIEWSYFLGWFYGIDQILDFLSLYKRIRGSGLQTFDNFQINFMDLTQLEFRNL